MGKFVLLWLFCLSLYRGQSDYGGVIDAGSTHTNLFLYRWSERESSTSDAPRSRPLEIPPASDNSDPIASAKSLDDVYNILQPQIVFMKERLKNQSGEWSTFPIYLKATAGMRILEQSQRELVLQWVRFAFNNKSFNPFFFDSSHAVIASGTEEATFDWLGVNMVLGSLESEGDETFGALDLGGQSTQIAFAAEPSSDILSDFTAVNLWGKTYRLYTHSFLRYGAVAIENRISQLVYDRNSSLNPCLMEGYSKNYFVTDSKNGSILNVTQYGNSKSNPYVCSNIEKELLLNETECFTRSCSINGVYSPDIPKNMTFYAFSAFAFQLSDLGMNNITLQNLIDFSLKICNMTYNEVVNIYQNITSIKFIYSMCMLQTYSTVLLKDAYKFNPNDNNLVFTNKINGFSLSWTQGSILRDANWLSWKLIKSNNSNCSNNTGGGGGGGGDICHCNNKTFVIVTIILSCLLVITCGLLIFVTIKLKSKTQTYQAAT